MDTRFLIRVIFEGNLQTMVFEDLYFLNQFVKINDDTAQYQLLRPEIRRVCGKVTKICMWRSQNEVKLEWKHIKTAIKGRKYV
jgi:hypothetical protein